MANSGMNINYSEERAGGVYSDRIYQNNRKNYVLPPGTEEDFKASQEAREKMNGVEVSFSPESVEFMSQVAARKEAANAERERIQQEIDQQMEGVNSFEYTGHAITQFSVFTRKLDEMGFYQGKSDEEVREMEDLLISMTHGMSGLRGGRAYGTKSDLSSYAARFELESSTAALKQFSEKYLSKDMQQSFHGLIDQYYEHNAAVLKDYKSRKEISDEAQAKLFESVGSKRLYPPSEKERMSHLSGKVKNTEEDIEKAADVWKDCLEKLRNKTYSTEEVMRGMNNILRALASGNSENQLFLKYVDEWNQPVMDHAGSYWSKLMDES